MCRNTLAKQRSAHPLNACLFSYKYKVYNRDRRLMSFFKANRYDTIHIGFGDLDATFAEFAMIAFGAVRIGGIKFVLSGMRLLLDQ